MKSEVQASSRFSKVNSFRDFDELLSGGLIKQRRYTREPNHFKASVSTQRVWRFNTAQVRTTNYTAEINSETLSQPGHPARYGLTLCTSNAYQIRRPGREEVFGEGEVIVTDSRMSSALSGEGCASSAAITMPITVWEEIAPPLSLPTFSLLRGETTSARLARVLALELIQAGEDMPESHSAVIGRQMIELVSLALTSASDHLPGTLNRQMRLRQIKAFIGQNLRDPTMGVARVADHFRVSPRYVSKLFADEDRTTMMSYLWEARLSKAADLLRQYNGTVMPLKEVCYRTGFSNPSHFSSRFSDKFGVSPTLYRQRELADYSK